ELTQVDAGGDQILVGVDRRNDVFCSNKVAAVSAVNHNSPRYKVIRGKMKYYSCGPQTCWGVNPAGRVFCRLNVHANSCTGSHWRRVDGRFLMVEVGTDGTVYGVDSRGRVFRRYGSPSAATSGGRGCGKGRGSIPKAGDAPLPPPPPVPIANERVRPVLHSETQAFRPTHVCVNRDTVPNYPCPPSESRYSLSCPCVCLKAAGTFQS
ncbi:fish-egg lectin-like, partial [Chiloscyllium plagiosum]|uniref:fish-egg lectin-like n=1 Tax=Chiloscyllium plagiosum TaxID=36176 RepID=UPI001CB88344